MKLKAGEVICPKCKGRKLVPETNEKGYIVRQWSCDRCGGTGKLDWVEMITGKRELYVGSSIRIKFTKSVIVSRALKLKRTVT